MAPARPDRTSSGPNTGTAHGLSGSSLALSAPEAAQLPSRLQRCISSVDLLPSLPWQNVQMGPVTTVAGTVDAWDRPKVQEICAMHARKLLGIVGLLLVLCGLVAGWVIAARVIASNNASQSTTDLVRINALLLHVAFAISLLVVLCIILRRVNDVLDHLRPSSQRANTPLRMAIPWLTPPSILLSYVHAVDAGRHATGDVEDRYIVGEPLPLYSNVRGSRLLLRSQSRVSARRNEPERPVSYITELKTEIAISAGCPKPSDAEATPSEPAPLPGMMQEMRRSVVLLEYMDSEQVKGNARCI